LEQDFSSSSSSSSSSLTPEIGVSR